MLIIDRFEGKYAIIEAGSEFINIPKCDKCGRHPVKYFEEKFIKTIYYADITGNPYIYTDRRDDYSLIPTKVTAESDCGNCWVIKGIVSTHQIVKTSDLKNKHIENNEYLNYIDYNTSNVIFEKKLKGIFYGPSEFAKIENEKYYSKRKIGITKKEIKQLLAAIKAGDNG